MKQTTPKVDFADLSRKDLDQANPAPYAQKFSKGLNKKLIQKISQDKNEPQWMLDLRLKALKQFQAAPLPAWGPDISHLDFEEIRYYATATDTPNAKTWAEVDPQIKKTFERLKIPEAEREMLAGVGAQYESENVYHNLKQQWQDMGVIFEDFDTAVHAYPELVQKHYGKCVPPTDHKFASLHYAVQSGGTFLYVPKGVEITEPLQAYFRMNAKNQGQFEHTLIIIEEGAKAHYIEGCSAPKYGSQSLHAGCVEVFVGVGAKFRYSSVENWSKDTYNLNTKRAVVQEHATMEWVGGNLGSGVTMLYPASLLVGAHARANHLGLAFANTGQTQDTGAKVIISAPHCRANVVSKTLCKGGGVSTYRGLVEVSKTAHHATVSVQCDSLMLDAQSTADTLPQINCHNPTTTITHEATAGKISDEVLLYLQSRGISKDAARGMIVNGFLDTVTKTLPLEYAVELNRLVELEMENSIEG